MKNCTPGNCGLDNPMSEFNLMGRMLTVLASEAVCVHTCICVYACIYICVCVCMSMYRCFENIQDLKMPVTLPIGLKMMRTKFSLTGLVISHLFLGSLQRVRTQMPLLPSV